MIAVVVSHGLVLELCLRLRFHFMSRTEVGRHLMYLERDEVTSYNCSSSLSGNEQRPHFNAHMPNNAYRDETSNTLQVHILQVRNSDSVWKAALPILYTKSHYCGRQCIGSSSQTHSSLLPVLFLVHTLSIWTGGGGGGAMGTTSRPGSRVLKGSLASARTTGLAR